MKLAIILVIIVGIAGVIAFFLQKQSPVVNQVMQPVAQSSTSSATDFKTYRGEKGIYSIFYPASWKVEPNTAKGVDVQFTDSEQVAVEQNLKIPVSLAILSGSTKYPTSKAYADFAIKDLQVIPADKTLKLISRKSVRVGDTDAEIIDFERAGGYLSVDAGNKAIMSNEQLIIVRSGTVYVLAANAPKSVWLKYEPIFNKMIDSFKFGF